MSVRSVVAAGSNRVLGVAFLVLLLTFVWGTYAIFTKKFVDVVPVTLKTSNIGLQLPALADVKIRGVIVGEVREIASDGEGARLELAMPLRRCRKLSAVRSAVSSARAWPLTSATTTPASQRSPSSCRA